MVGVALEEELLRETLLYGTGSRREERIGEGEAIRWANEEVEW